MKFAYRMKKYMISEKDNNQFHDAIDQDKRKGILDNQKVIVESLLYLDDFNLIVYTTICPKCSIIFISSSKKNQDYNSKSQIKKLGSNQNNNKHNNEDSEIFESKLLARLIGHNTSNPPTIYYCKESGYLISAEKADK